MDNRYIYITAVVVLINTIVLMYTINELISI